ncbi:ABC transporter permease subunit [Nocardioides marmotae]|uniref:branched-chain amino acid ABC transporter ATP-binding protein/permease n=1 Tax=Nocardioides marmotae TaxID=2663857 RepID=UPI0012B612E7|nr:branched-chain amino acid ABC transporter ATP-binding protein/permease [Nocardioides marmotae]MBC9732346.1 branched-chain amino acid ABC transporter ATP-binding protein/permease [Nocardioides marmotae]MTB83466.1 ATP-binding cassette domain-containing protein [Nocardioides marmotae]
MTTQILYELICIAGVFGIFAVSLNLLVGWTGIPAVAPTAFGAVGGYLAAYLAINNGMGFLTTLLVAVVAAGALGLVISATSLQLSIENVILLTVALGTIVLSVATSVPSLGGPNGLVNVPNAELFGATLDSSVDWIPVMLGVLAFTYLLTYAIGESGLGLTLKGVREDELAVRSVGLNPLPGKIAAFTISSAFAGLAGALLVYYNNVASPNSFGFNQGILIVTMIILGGLGRPIGPVAGAVLVAALPKVLEQVIQLEPSRAALIQQVVYGLLLIAVMLFRPSGLVPEKSLRVVRRFAAKRLAEADRAALDESITAIAGDVEVVAAAESDHGRERPVVLRGTELRKRFGGLVVADGFDFELPGGEVVGLVGPNGAGKTTLFNLLTGAVPLDSGDVQLLGADVTRKSMDQVVRAGMARSFQDVRLFQGITLLENVLLGALEPRTISLWRIIFQPWAVRRETEEALERAWVVLERLHLEDKALVLGGKLSYGERKIAAIGRLMATDSRVMLLDEPAAGVGPELAEAILRIITQLREEGRTILLVEHNLEVVRDVATSVFFMESGRIRAHGTYDELISDPALAASYFGAGHTEHAAARGVGAPAVEPTTTTGSIR